MLNLGGTFREISAEQTLARVGPMLWDVFGISRVANITGLDNTGVHTCLAIRPNSKVLSNSQGKGMTENLAKASAIMESIEIWHGENLPEPDLVGSYNQLVHRYPLIKIESLQTLLYSPKMNDLVQGWVRAKNLISNADIYLPYSYFNLDRVTFTPGYELLCPTTNGLASGNSLDEALCHALFELIEREGRAKIKGDKLASRQLDLTHLPSPMCADLVQRIVSAGYRLKVYDVRTELDIPVYSANLDDITDVRNIGLFGGAGCHFSDEIAFLRAVTEAVQSRLTYIAGARDDINLNLYAKKRETITAETIGQHRPVYNQEMPDSLSACLSKIILRLHSHGYHQIYAYDLTRENIGIPVVHAMVPGLVFNSADALFKVKSRI